MGTNYYVRPAPCEHPCPHCTGPADIHLGKSSMGWAFTFRGYPELDFDPGRSAAGPVVTDYASWLLLLDLGRIRDEYGRQVTRDDLLERIENKRGGLNTLHDGDRLDADGNRFVNAEFS